MNALAVVSNRRMDIPGGAMSRIAVVFGLLMNEIALISAFI